MNAITTRPDAAPVADPMVTMIERVAMTPDLPIERLTALMDMRERQMNKEAEQGFNQAFAAAMAEMPDVPRTGENRHLGTRYSTLDDLIRATRPVLSRHGLSLNWQTKIDGQNITVTAIVRHAQGHSISTTLSGPRDNGKQMNALQGGGSTETYLKRYSGFGILGLSSGDETDDDGQRASAVPLIDADQFVALREMIEESGSNEAKFLEFIGAPTLEELTHEQFAKAIAALRKKIQRNKKAAAE
ncbi:ERF family protein [Paracoccus phage Shpa]|uniref:ERF family protein n=1 Tax=Paracoccus phage Shpa TaxID=1647282 RepID=A0A0U2C0X9_9CAUD|nr:Erf-like ssDNA annealing protein [Paracoccus phage Shpa]AKG94551.1 ERF family protein [Paracoccus phage Shpa]